MIKKIINILLFNSLIGLFLVLFFFITNHNLINDNNLSTYINEADILNIKASYIFDVTDDITVLEKLEEMAFELAIPEEIIDDILKSEELTSILAEYFKISLNSYYDEVILSNDLIEKMIEIALVSSEDHLNIVLSDDVLEELIITYCNNVQSLMPEKLEVIGNSKILKIWNYSFDFNQLYLLLIGLVIVVLVTLVNKDFKKSIKYIGLTLMITGIIFVLFGSLDGVLNNYLTDELDGIKVILSPLITQLATIWFQTGFLLSFSGILIYLIFVFIKRIEAT